VLLEVLVKLKKKIHLIGIRIRYLPACSIVPQPTTLPRATVGLDNFTKYKYNGGMADKQERKWSIEVRN
jgi:hypothetical protein